MPIHAVGTPADDSLRAEPGDLLPDPLGDLLPFAPVHAAVRVVPELDPADGEGTGGLLQLAGKPPLRHIPRPLDPHFTAREDQLESIHKLFVAGRSSPPTILAITGTDDSGKAQTALAYALGIKVSKIGFKYSQSVAHGNPIVLYTPATTGIGWTVRALHQTRASCRTLPH